jgi:pimeloyl-ACP methyl ester carboxylesterase
MSAVIDWNVKPIAVRDDGLVGTLFLPGTPPPHPIVITLGGSSPGIFTPPAALLASNGIAALALAYFGVGQLPRALKQIPLEYFGTAIQWCSRREELRPNAIAVAGGSRGGELALLLAATFPEIVAVVGWSASGLLYGGIDKPDRPVAAWNIGGSDLPFAGFDLTAVNWNERPLRMTSGFIAALSDEKTVRAAEIPVERINGPVLLMSGTDDQVWPSSILSEIAIRRLRDHNHPFRYEHLSYDGAGHGIGPPLGRLNTTHFVHPVLGQGFEFGGTPDLNWQASLSSWQHIVAFLEASLET